MSMMWRKFKGEKRRLKSEYDETMDEYNRRLKDRSLKNFTQEYMFEFHMKNSLGRDYTPDPWYPKTLKAIAILTPREDEDGD
jgi:hypothetical protein